MDDLSAIKAAIVKELQRQRLEIGQGRYPIMQSIDIHALAIAVGGKSLVFTAGVDIQAQGAQANVAIFPRPKPRLEGPSPESAAGPTE